MIAKIKADFAQDESGPNVEQYLRDYVNSGSTDYRSYVFFNDHKYARNLVEINEHFELMIICWKVGQESPIHNHSGQKCWMSFLEGDMEETYYTYDEATGTVTQGESQVHKKGGVGFIVDEIALHKVRPASASSIGITMHMYSKPIAYSTLYCPLTGKITRRRSGFYSIKGHKLVCGQYTGSCYEELYKALEAKATAEEESHKTKCYRQALQENLPALEHPVFQN
jgi:cysteine dioxygenase